MCYLNSRKILVIVFLSIVLCRVFESFCSTSNLSLSARFSDVVIENLDIGETYNISQMKGLPLTIINGSDIETQIIVEVDVQNPAEYEDYKKLMEQTVQPLFQKWKDYCLKQQLLVPQVVYGYFPCQADGDRLIIYREDQKTEWVRFAFPRQKETWPS